MTVRKSRKRARSLADVAEGMPAALLRVNLSADDPLVSLRAYMADLQVYLSAGLGCHAEQHVVAEVMAGLGVDAATCYRVMLGNPCRDRTGKSGGLRMAFSE